MTTWISRCGSSTMPRPCIAWTRHVAAAVLSDPSGPVGPAARQAAFLRPRRFIVPATAVEASKTAALSSG